MHSLLSLRLKGALCPTQSSEEFHRQCLVVFEQYYRHAAAVFCQRERVRYLAGDMLGQLPIILPTDVDFLQEVEGDIPDRDRGQFRKRFLHDVSDAMSASGGHEVKLYDVCQPLKTCIERYVHEVHAEANSLTTAA